MKKIEFQYLAKHESDGKIEKFVYSLEDIENQKFNQPGWKIIARRQYTGVKDSDRIKVYDGDIVIIYGESIGNGIKTEVIFKHGSFRFSIGSVISELTSILNFKIIGNIYENNELLVVNHE